MEAVAFCRWLSARLGNEVRLPTEWEWQQAATGGDPANEYPWGPWDSSRANTYESELQRSTAVGVYPHGVSPVGALDMSGNLWEWCLNEHENPKRVKVSGKESRAVRGGSWDINRANARCAFRYWNLPDGRTNYVGFRLVCASHIFPHLLWRRWATCPPLNCCERSGRQRPWQRFRQWPTTTVRGPRRRV